MDPLTIGSLAVGGIGSLFGMFKDDPEYTLPDLSALKRSNPELYDQLMQIKYMADEARREAAREGITSAERIQMEDARSNLRSQQANRGLAGSSVAADQQAELANRMMAAQQQRAFQESMARRNQAANLSGQFANAYMGIAQPQAQAKYQQDLANQEAQNRFFGGLVNSGLNMYGTERYLDRLAPVASGGGNMSPVAINAMAKAAQRPWNPQVNYGSRYQGPIYGGAL